MKNERGNIGILAVLVVAALALATIANLSGFNSTPDPRVEFEDRVYRFANEQEIIAAFQDAQGGSNIYKTLGGAPGAIPTTAQDSSTEGGSAGENRSYTTTNVQVEGVDEADIVKTDGEYIYSFYKSNLIITKAFPAEDMQIVSKTLMGDLVPQEMFVKGNQLVVFGHEYAQGPIYYADAKIAVPEGGVDLIYPPYWGQSKVVVRVFDISDKANPEVVKDIAYTGNYNTSRLIGNQVYVVVSTYPEYRILAEEGEGSIIPKLIIDGEEFPLAQPSRIGYIPPIQAEQFITIGALDLQSLQLTNETIVGRAETVYASLDRVLITHTEWNYPTDDRPMPVDFGGSIGDSRPMPVEVDGGIGDTPPSVTETPALNEDDSSEPYQQTVVHAFELSGNTVSYIGKGKVTGRVLNQFSMDYFEGNIRLATTLDGQWDWRTQTQSQSTNHVWVLDSDMKVIGQLNDIAPGEQIYSARFMGERAYLVTFQRIDPLFVLDLSAPTNPKILGKLKIPGYSDYLHPLGENRLIGVGKDTALSKDGDFAYYLGMKVAIFNVENVSNPIEEHVLYIGDRGTDSYALQDHKAFLYDDEKNLLVLPINLYEVLGDEPKYGDAPAYGTPTFQGAFVYQVDTQSGFEELGRITHISAEADLKSGYYYDYAYQVKRSLRIGDVLYTISDKMIQAHHVDTLEEIKILPFVNIPNTFKVTSRIEGSFCAGPCGFQEVEISKDKIRQTSFSGGEKGLTNTYEYYAYGTYEDVFENLDWELFQDLDETLGCPGCADGPVETITITDGTKTHTVRMEAGMKVEGLQGFLNLIRQYTWQGPVYGGWEDGVVGASTPASAPATIDPAI